MVTAHHMDLLVLSFSLIVFISLIVFFFLHIYIVSSYTLRFSTVLPHYKLHHSFYDLPLSLLTLSAFRSRSPYSLTLGSAFASLDSYGSLLPLALGFLDRHTLFSLWFTGFLAHSGFLRSSFLLSLLLYIIVLHNALSFVRFISHLLVCALSGLGSVSLL